MHIHAAKVPNIDTIGQGTVTKADLIGGERFGVRFMSSDDTAVWSMEGILEGEAFLLPRSCDGCILNSAIKVPVPPEDIAAAALLCN